MVFISANCYVVHHNTERVVYIYSILRWFWIQSGQFRLSTIPKKAEIQVELGHVRCELDISIVDRLNSLLQPQKLATAELMASHLYTSYNKHVSLVRMDGMKMSSFKWRKHLSKYESLKCVLYSKHLLKPVHSIKPSLRSFWMTVTLPVTVMYQWL